jgi:dienelactone hydrolase
VLIASNSGDNCWPKPGFNKVVATRRQTDAVYDAADRLSVVFDLRSHSMTPFIPDIDVWFEKHLKALDKSHADPRPVGQPVNPDTNMIRYFQRRIEKQASEFPTTFDSPDAWTDYRNGIVAWLEKACAIHELGHGPATMTAKQERDGLVAETTFLPQDSGFACPAVIYRAAGNIDKTLPAMILSHHSLGCAADHSVMKIARALAQNGFAVLVPEHASTNGESLRRTDSQQKGANFISLYGVGDTVGLSPLVQRVWDDLSCVEYLSKRPDIDQRKILAAGMGIGGVDAALCAALDSRVAGAALIGVMTVQDWAQEVAPIMHHFDRVMPYLPSITTKTDLQYLYAAVAPRPLLLVDGTDRRYWPESGFQRAKATATHVYEVVNAGGKLSVVPARSEWGVEELSTWATATVSGARKE